MERIVQIPRLAANYLILSGAEFVSKIIAAIALAYLARVFGPQSYGYLEFAIAIYFIAALMVDCGLSYVGARELAKDNTQLPELFVHITFARTVLAVLVFILLALIAAFINQPSHVKTMILIYGLVMFVLPWLIQWVFQGHDLMKYVGIASVTRWSVFTAAVFCLVKMPDQTWIVPVIEGAALICTAIFLLISLYRLFGFPRYKLKPRYAFILFKKAVPIGASEMVWAVKIYFATILLGFVIGGTALGWFTAAHRIVVALHAFVWLYFYNLLPSIARTTKHPVDVLQNLMKVSLTITAWAGIFIGIYGAVFSEIGITLIFGPQYKGSTEIFQVLIWLIPLALMSGHFRYTLIGYDLQKYEFYCALIGAGINVLLNLMMVPRFGIIGSALALVLSELVIWISAYGFVGRRITIIPVFSRIWRPLIGGGLLVIMFYYMRLINLLIAGIFGLIFYTAIFILIEPEARRNIKILINR